MITWLNFSHGCKNVQVMDATFWCNDHSLFLCIKNYVTRFFLSNQDELLIMNFNGVGPKASKFNEVLC